MKKRSFLPAVLALAGLLAASPVAGLGFRDEGGPGERPIYHPGYYGAFVLDPDGHNIEAVCHEADPVQS